MIGSRIIKLCLNISWVSSCRRVELQHREV
uniref:Uncharacterized protein n=1 Tax=Lepeophtheirus salmonis TaxID=72036 RepID=A0A0K2VFB6_LEPSM